jgi:hypothetical protein
VGFETVLLDDGGTPTPPLVARLTVAAVDQDRHVDPEDWSPQPDFQPTVSPSLFLQVAQDSILPMGEVVPVALIVPLLPLTLLVFGVARSRRRSRAP